MKFNIFNSGLIEFMKMLNEGKWSEKDATADFGSYIIDHINMFKDLNYKDDSNHSIVSLFKDLYNDRKIIEDYRRIQEHKNLIR